MLSDVALMGNDSVRTRCYLDVLIRRGLAPSHLIVLGSEGPAATLQRARVASFENTIPPIETAGRWHIPVTSIDQVDVNAPEVAAAVAPLTQTIVIYSVTGGAIVRDALFSTGKRFLHVHPGRLPDFRGSTTIYYTLLAGRPVTATALFLSPTIDAGPIVASRSYAVPQDRRAIDIEFDSYMRADLLAAVLEDYTRTGTFGEIPQSERAGETYYIIHPVLKHLAILGTEPTCSES